jgi:hypothetical protein
VAKVDLLVIGSGVVERELVVGNSVNMACVALRPAASAGT